jgi:hypothetical protein
LAKKRKVPGGSFSGKTEIFASLFPFVLLLKKILNAFEGIERGQVFYWTFFDPGEGIAHGAVTLQIKILAVDSFPRRA